MQNESIYNSLQEHYKILIPQNNLLLHLFWTVSKVIMQINPEENQEK